MQKQTQYRKSPLFLRYKHGLQQRRALRHSYTFDEALALPLRGLPELVDRHEKHAPLESFLPLFLNRQGFRPSLVDFFRGKTLLSF
jgi:hypothetical protein